MFRMLIAVMLLALARVDAQQAEVRGSVTDATAAVLPGTSVELVNEASGVSRNAVTDGRGRFAFAAVEPGTYSLSFRLTGFEPLTRRGISVGGEMVNIGDVALRAGPLAETVQRPRPLPRPRDMRPECLHGRDETEAERQRRSEALAAMRLIASLLERVPPSSLGYPDWETLARSKAVSDLQNGDGPAAELARRVRWGDAEPLPGWGMTYIHTRFQVRFTLTDLRDACGFSYDSAELVVLGRVLPLR